MSGRLALGLLLAACVLAVAAGRVPARAAAPRTAPEGPPLVSPGGGPAANGEGTTGASPVVGGEGTPGGGRRGGRGGRGGRRRAIGSLASGTGDPLVKNGMGSPLCSYAARGELSGVAAANCRTDDFVASGAPTEDYAFDIHIDRGAFGIGENNFAATIQNVILTPVWTALVWTAHTLLVGIEWCYTLNILDSPSMRSIRTALREVESTFTQPWLVLVMALAAVLAAYHGIVRRRVAETTGQVLMMLAMMAAGLWVIFDPVGTVGALGSWADEASIGTLGAVAHGSPARAPESLAGSMAELFQSSVEGPWCYMEFGDVSWCRNSSQLDPSLHRAALAIAEGLPSEPSEGGPHSAELIRAAKSNGELFLSLPANGDKRNSINDTSSLLRVLCQSSQATECSGPTAPQAEFRTPGFTMARAVGLLLIIAGLAGMFLTLGFLMMRLLEAAVATLIYLLMAPAAVLAPALGDGGRAAFRSWGARLLGSIASKIVHSFVLGVLLLLLSFLVSLESVGWWIQWLLISTLWWSAFRQRHKLLGLAIEPRHHSLRGAAGRFMSLPRYAESSMVIQGVQWARRRHKEREAAAERRREAAADAGEGEGRMEESPPGSPARRNGGETTDSGWAPSRSSGQGGEMTDSGAQGERGDFGADTRQIEGTAQRQRLAGETEERRQSAAATGSRARVQPGARAASRTEGDPQAVRMHAAAVRQAEALRGEESAHREGLEANRSRLERLRSAGRGAAASREDRREVSLGLRTERVAAEVTSGRERLERARVEAEPGAVAVARQGALLDEQASLPGAREMRGHEPASAPGRGGRDYRALAPLAGGTAEDYERMDPGTRRRARLQIDRELDQRRRVIRERRESHRRADRSADAAERGTDAAGRGADVGTATGGPEQQRASPRERAASEAMTFGSGTGRGRGNRIMEDAFAVEEGRKRQLGYAELAPSKLGPDIGDDRETARR